MNNSDADLFQWMFGYGHGAVYYPVISFPEPNVTDGYRVHNIHIHLFLWLYRYGILGSLLYTSFCIFVIYRFAMDFLFYRKIDLIDNFLVMSSIIIVMRSLFYSPINDPINMFIIVSMICYPLLNRHKNNVIMA